MLKGSKASTPLLLQLLDKMVTKGIIHKNNAARNKSRTLAKAKAIAPDLELPKLTGLKTTVSVKEQKEVVAEKPETKKAPAKKASNKKTTESKAKTKKKK